MATLYCSALVSFSPPHRLRGQIPDIQKSLDMVTFLKSKQGSADSTATHFLLSDSVYGTAEIPPTDSVLLWLGVGSGWLAASSL